MRRTLAVLMSLALTAAILPARGVQLGAYIAGFAPRDDMVRSIYGNGADLAYGLVIGVPLWRGFSLRFQAGHYERNGETSFTGEISRLRLYPLSLGLRYTFRLRKISPFLQADYHGLVLTEASAIGEIDDQGSGYALSAGAALLFSSRFSLEFFLRYTDVSVNVAPWTVQMGGVSAGLAFLVRL